MEKDDIKTLSTFESSNPDAALDQIPDTPLFPLNYKEMGSLAKLLFKSSLPSCIGSVTIMLNGLICLRFIGQQNDPDMLAGASLANTWGNAFCVGIILSINMGFTVLASQAFGGKQYHKLGVLYQRALCVMGLIAIPLILSLLMTESILDWFGLDPKISANAGLYLRYLIPSIIGDCLLECTMSFLMAQNDFISQAYVQIFTSILHYGWCYFLVDILGLSIKGAAIAKSITDLSSAGLLMLYIKYSGKYNHTWIPWNKECLQGWGTFLKETSVIGANLYVEWIACEASILIAGALNDEYILGAHGLAISLQIVLFTIPAGNNISMQTYIGNAAGEGSKNKAQKVAAVGLAMNFIFSSINVFFLLTFTDEIAAIFTPDVKTQELFKSMIVIYSFGLYADTFSSHFGGILKTIGSEEDVLKRFVFSYVIIGLNCQWIFGVWLGFGYMGIWLSMNFGMYLMSALMVIMLWDFDWDYAIRHVEAKMQQCEIDEKDGDYIEMEQMV